VSSVKLSRTSKIFLFPEAKIPFQRHNARRTKEEVLRRIEFRVSRETWELPIELGNFQYELLLLVEGRDSSQGRGDKCLAKPTGLDLGCTVTEAMFMVGSITSKRTQAPVIKHDAITPTSIDVFASPFVGQLIFIGPWPTTGAMTASQVLQGCHIQDPHVLHVIVKDQFERIDISPVHGNIVRPVQLICERVA
jgi:hypothetical protein